MWYVWKCDDIKWYILLVLPLSLILWWHLQRYLIFKDGILNIKFLKEKQYLNSLIASSYKLRLSNGKKKKTDLHQIMIYKYNVPL